MNSRKKVSNAPNLGKGNQESGIAHFAGKVINKNQDKFNRLVEEIKKLADEFEVLKEELPPLQRKFSEATKPFAEKMLAANHKLILSADVFFREMKLSKKQKETVSEFILLKITQLPEIPPEKIQEVFDRFSPKPFQEIIAEENEVAALELTSIIREMFNLKEDLDLSLDPKLSQEENMARILQQLGEMGIHPNMKGEKPKGQDAETFSEKPKTDKQKAKEMADSLRREKEEDLKKKSFKSIYMELMKAFHPDTETDPERKAEKEEISKKITVAYGNQDYFTLLKLEAEFLSQQEGRFQSLPKEQLDFYVKMLTNQKAELKSQLNQVKAQFSEVYHIVYKQRKNLTMYLKTLKEELVRQEKMLYSQSNRMLILEPMFKKDVLEEMEAALLFDAFYGDDDMDDFF